MTDVNKQQNAVSHQGAPQTQQQSQQQTGQQAMQQQQQQVESQTIQVQQVQISHDGTQQMHPQGPQVVSSAATTMVMPGAAQQAILSQQAMQNLQSPQSLPSIPSQGAAVTAMNPQQQMSDWAGHGRVQVIQQPIQNPTYLQPVYNAQGQLIVPGNIALHPANMNQPIQVIAAGKPFQPGQMPHMLTQGKPVVQGQATTFPGYATIPTSGNNQTLVISQLGVLGQNILPATLQQQGKPQDIQKMITKSNGPNTGMKVNSSQPQNVSLSNMVSSQPQAITTQAPAIIQPQILSSLQYACGTQQQRVAQGPVAQFTPWQTFTPTQGLTWTPGAIQGSTLLTQGSPIFIRNPQHDAQPGMFIHNAQTQLQQPNQIQGQQMGKTNQAIEVGSNVQPKTAITKTFSTILPNSVAGANIRPASSVSTQTGQTQTHALVANFQSQKAATKVRTKNMCRMTSMATAPKSDAANQTKTGTPPGPSLTPKSTTGNGQAMVTTPPSSTMQDKMKQQQQQPQTPDPMQGQQQTVHQQAQAQQPQQQQQMAQLQQMQSMFQQQQQQQQQMQAKPSTVPLMVNNGMPGTPDRAVLPVGAMPTGPMTPLMGNMIVQAVPGITAMPPGLPMPGAPTAQTVPMAPQLLPQPVPMVEQPPPPPPQQQQQQQAQPQQQPPQQTLEKQEETEHKEEMQEGGGPGTGPGRPAEEATAAVSTEESTDSAAKVDDKCVMKQEVTPQCKDKSGEDKENVETDRKSEKDATGVTHGPKAMVMVKPQVLTHVIEGFVIQESSEPFPVNRGYMDGGVKNMVVRDALEGDEPPNKKAFLDPKEDGKRKEYAVCQTCGKKDLKSKFKKSKRFCSLSCAKRDTDEKRAADNDNTDTNDSTGGESGMSPTQEGAESQGENNAQDDTAKVNPLQWSVAEVCEFIRALPGCSDYAEDFAIQDIDGEALMLLKADHLMTVMSMKLGPAVKIIAKIDTMRVDSNNTASSPPKQ